MAIPDTSEICRGVEDAIAWEAAREAPPADFPPLPEIPGGRYTRQDFHDLEVEHVWRKSWIYACREEEVREPGSYRAFNKLGPPIIVVRGKDDVVRAFYNTCRHRGAPVVRDEAGKVGRLRCQYHSWSYALDGTLVSVPDERDFACLNKADRGLLPVRCETWGGMVFINEDQSAMPLADYLGGLPHELACVGMDGLRVVETVSYEIDCNWKAAVDAFLEVYHINTIHPTNAGVMLHSKAAAMGLMPHGHSRMATRKNMNQGINFVEFEGAPDIATMPDFYRNNNVAYNIFPNLVTPVEPTGFPILLFWPRGLRKTEMVAVYVAPDWGDGERPAFWDRFLPIFDAVLQEDMMNLAPIQQSLDSGAFTGMMINYQERRIYWFHEELDRRIGADRMPPELRVAPVLGDHVEPLPLALAAE
ncbi:aromatic ring-hydroxylating oxygenase subunit alpha [Sphingomonas profundi]|uniref:aromatic ring-hydroxylating oxygenase subunit alpha n=1 Tax=Alterirhizorhabdus profundi TaxID=2681549 RepID=UPI0012E7814F|nr:SRPBCC family protein [Sphingomonas profundi]